MTLPLSFKLVSLSQILPVFNFISPHLIVGELVQKLYLSRSNKKWDAPYPGHIIYHEVLKIRIKFDGEELEGHFGDRSVINSDGKMLLINRIADPAYFAKFTSALTNN